MPRRAQPPLGSSRFSVANRFSEAYQSHPGVPLLHLGDLLDMSCQFRDEEKCAKVFDRAKQHSAFVPETMMAGSSESFNRWTSSRITLNEDALEWRRGCRTERRMTIPPIIRKGPVRGLTQTPNLSAAISISFLRPPARPGLKPLANPAPKGWSTPIPTRRPLWKSWKRISWVTATMPIFHRAEASSAGPAPPERRAGFRS